jgi:hypothetical protein
LTRKCDINRILWVMVNRQSDGRSENSVLDFKISSFRKRDECDIYLNLVKKHLSIVNIRIN